MSAEPVPGIYAGSTCGKSTLCKTYPDEFFDPEDVPQEDRPARLQEIRDLKPWRSDTPENQALTREMNQIFAGIYVKFGRGRVPVCHMVSDDAFAAAIRCVPVMAFMRKPAQIVIAQQRRGDDSPDLPGMIRGFERAQAWARNKKIPTVTLTSNQFLTSPDILDSIRRAVEDFYG